MNIAIKIVGLCLLLSSPLVEAVQFGGPFGGPLGQKYRNELEQLVVPADRLPSSCQLVTETQTASIFPATTNPFVTDDARLIDFVSLLGFGNRQLPDVIVAMSALYVEREPKHEIGIWGLRFRSAKAALAGYQKFGQREVPRKGALLVTLWRDDEMGAACQLAIKAHLIKNSFELLPVSPRPPTGFLHEIFLASFAPNKIPENTK